MNTSGELPTLPYSLSIQTTAGSSQELITYPIEDYAGAGELFDGNFIIENSSTPPIPPIYTGEKALCYYEAYIGTTDNQWEVSSTSLEVNKKEQKKDNSFSDISSDFFRKEKIELKALPNPFNSYIKLELPFDLEESSQITIRDFSGKVKWSGESQNQQDFQIATEDWQIGLYIVTVSSQNKQMHYKIMKN